MDIKKIEEIFFIESEEKSHVEILDKQRGYGIVIIKLQGNLTFGIPLRSNLRKHNGFVVMDNKGLDFSKAILLENESYISNEPFIIPKDEYNTIQDNEFIIEKKFLRYVSIYIQGILRSDQNILRKYQYSTLQNYQSELIRAEFNQN